MQPDLHTTTWHPRKTSVWRQLLGACGGVETRTWGQKTSHKESLSTKGGEVNVLLTASAGSNDSSRSTVHQTIAAASVTHTSVCNKSDQLPEKMLVTSILESGGEQQSSPGLGALSSGSSYVGTQALCVSIAANRHATVQIESPDYSSLAPVDVSLVPKRDTTAVTSLGRLHVALSANSIRDIAQCDPTMRIRHLRPLSYSPGTVVYKGTWQGLLIAVKFMLYRGGDAQGVQRRVSSLLASHCMPQRSQLARVYACDMSEVVYGASPPAAAVATAAEPPTTSRRPLTVRPLSLDDLDEDDANLLLSARSSEVHDTADGIHQASPSSPCEAGRGRCGTSSRGVSQFHFSSVVFSDPSDVIAVAAEGFTGDTGPASTNSTSVAPGPSLTIQGLLDHLGARPGDYLLHCVSELASGGNLWHGIRSGTYDMYGPLGPLGAARSVVHTARGIAQGLHQLHTAGEVHGGLSPRNVVLLWSNARGELVDDGAGAWRDSQESPGLYSRRGFTARVADCGMRRLVLGGEWRSRLEENPELRMCTAPELLKLVPAAEAGDVILAAATAEIEWLPHHDVFSFGALLYCMCTGHHRDDPEAASAIWPDHAWDPLRNLSDVCMAPDPSARPTSREIVSALLVLEQRLHYAGGGLTRCLRVPASRRCGSTARGSTVTAAMPPPTSAVTARHDGRGATTYEEADIVDAAAVFLHATAEEEATKKAGTGLEQTAPEAGRALLCTQFHSEHRQTFALSSMPEVLLLHPCGEPGLKAPHVIF